jgi:hypothetical protein
MWKPGAMILFDGSSYHYLQTVDEIQNTTAWEAQGAAGDAAFWDYDPDDHYLYDDSWPDFHPTVNSTNAIDHGTSNLPDSLKRLLGLFAAEDHYWGSAVDIGRYEGGFAIVPSPPVRLIKPGGTAHYALHVFPDDVPYTVSLNLDDGPAGLSAILDPDVIISGSVATLMISDIRTNSLLLPGSWNEIALSGKGGGFARTIRVPLLVGGTEVYMPLTLKR